MPIQIRPEFSLADARAGFQPGGKDTPPRTAEHSSQRQAWAEELSEPGQRLEPEGLRGAASRRAAAENRPGCGVPHRLASQSDGEKPASADEHFPGRSNARRRFPMRRRGGCVLSNPVECRGFEMRRSWLRFSRESMAKMVAERVFGWKAAAPGFGDLRGLCRD